MTTNGDVATMTMQPPAARSIPDRTIIVRMTVQVTVDSSDQVARVETLEYTDVGRVYETTQGTLIMEDVYGLPRAGYASGTWSSFVVTGLDALQPGDGTTIQSSPGPIAKSPETE